MSFRRKHSSKALAILLFVMATIVAVGLNPTVVGNAAPVKQEAQPAKKQERQGLKPNWKDAGPDSSWSFFDRKKAEPKVAKSKPRSYVSLHAWQQFAASKGVSLEGIPEELLLELAKDPYGDLVVAIMFVESAFQPKNKTANNYGLMQIADVHFRDYAKAQPYIHACGVKKKKDLFDPHKNVCVGMSFFYELLQENSMNRHKALMAYNSSHRKKAYAAKVDRTYKEIVALKRHVI